MTEFISNLIGNDYISTVIMSFVPLIELKGAIVYATSVGFGIILAFALSYLGSTLVFFPIHWLLKPVLNLMKKINWFKGLAEKVENYFSNKASETMEKRVDKAGKNGIDSDVRKKMLSVFIFVAIPLPMTGVWTGTAIAVFLNLKFKHAVLPVVLGNFIAGVLIALLSMLCQAIGVNLDYVLYALFSLALVLLVVTFIKISRSKDKNKSIDKDISGDK